MRLFVALELPDRVREGIRRLQAELRSELPAARWVAPERQHLTLVFLGEQPGEVGATLEERLAAAFGEALPLRLKLAEPGFFPARGRARVAWLGVRLSAPLHQLQSRLVRATRDLLSATEARRPYRPHLTMARPRRPWSSVDRVRFLEVAGAWGEDWTVDRGVLLESVVGGGPGVYRPVAFWAAQGAS